MTDANALKAKVDEALKGGRPADAVCYLAELTAADPMDRFTRTALAIALGDAGSPSGALKVLRALADRLAHDGWLMPAMVVIRHGLEHAPNDASLNQTLRRLHVRGVRAKAGKLAIPPALKPKKIDDLQVDAGELLKLPNDQRLERATQAGLSFPPAGEAAMPIPMPLFSELDEESFVETVRRLHYRRVAKGARLLTEGEPGSTLLVIASGHVNIEKGGNAVAKLGPGSVIGEMALLTGAPRSASAVAHEEVEVFELSRSDVEQLAKAKPQVAEELVEYCKKRIIANTLRTSPLFSKFDDTARFTLLDSFKRVAFQAGQKIITQGQNGTGLFVVATGEVEVSIAKDGHDVVVANLGPGQVVGEISLLQETPATATVTARGIVGALFLPRADFQQILGKYPEAREYLTTLSADRIKASKAAAEHEEVLDADDLIVL